MAKGTPAATTAAAVTKADMATATAVAADTAIDRSRIVSMSILLDLFLTFARIGLFTFGGGYAMISLIDRSCVEKKRWISHDEMMDITVIAESTPGPIAINCATYVGYKQKGLVGAVAATVGIILPSFCIIFIISSFLDGFLEIAWIAHAFMGIKIAVGILILDAAVKMISKMPKKPLPLAIMGGAFCAMMLVNIFAVRVSSITLMLIAGILSLSIFLAKRNAGDGGRS
jgi:chromate transporter